MLKARGSLGLVVFVLLAGTGVRARAADAPPQAGGKPNVLFIASDDMRPQLGCYGDPLARSPHLDRLAARGVVFMRAYCQQALCSPSRISLLSGRYPSTSGVYTIGPALREKMPDVVTLPQHFKAAGYEARSLGKIYHIGIDDPASWSLESFVSKTPRYGPEGQKLVKQQRQALVDAGKPIPKQGKGAPHYGLPFEAPDVPDDALTDGDTAKRAVEIIKEYGAKPGKPFFLAVGFVNPHVPWVAPKKYFDLYDPAKIPIPANNYAPRNAPKFAAQTGADFHWYKGVPEVVDDAYGRQCIQAYLAAISYVDAQVGRLLDALDQAGLAKNTVVVFWGDHGYYMGEHGWWGGKHNNYEGATRAPLIVSVPGLSSAGKKSDAIVEFVDIYPSLAEICGLPAPSGAEGASFKANLEDPMKPGKAGAFSFYPKGGYQGVTLRTDRWRFVEWHKKGADPVYELYDHQADPDENQNVADKPEHAAVIKDLSAKVAGKFKP